MAEHDLDLHDSDAIYAEGNRLARRNGVRPIPQAIRRKAVWSLDELSQATGLSNQEAAELAAHPTCRKLEGGVVWAEDILDLLGVRWALPGDAAATYVTRCRRAGVGPDPFVALALVEDEVDADEQE